MQCKRVAFDSGHLCERGTDVALWDYADLNESELGNESLICCPARAPLPCLDRFRARFPVLLYQSIDQLAEQLDGFDLYYRITHGRRDASWPLPRREGLRTAVHAVFEPNAPHGDSYAAVSSFVARRVHKGQAPVDVVPHVVRALRASSTDYRAELGIPRDATVFGRHGGYETFDLPFAREAVRQAARARPDLHFVFVNTERFDEHPRVHFLDPILDDGDKAAFIDSCDAMLHARAMGESFGLAIAEFSVRRKPVYTWFCGRDRHHIDVLRDRGRYYLGLDDLFAELLRFAPEPAHADYDVYSERFSPSAVMSAFDEVFLQRQNCHASAV